MKLATHVATALVASLIVAVLLGARCDYVVYATFFAAVYASQYALDAVGHTVRTIHGRRVPVRNRLHSLPGVTAWGAAWGAPFIIRGCPALAAGLLAGLLLHYVEDMVTESGVYLLGRRRRKAPVTFSYDDPWVNAAAISVAFLAGLALVADKWPEMTQPQRVYAAAALLYSLYALLHL